jgi:hypothetical protein
VVRTGKVSLLREHLPQAAARHVEKRREGMIDGLQLTIPGEEVRRLLEQRLEDHHRQRADWRFHLERRSKRVGVVLPRELAIAARGAERNE